MEEVEFHADGFDEGDAAKWEKLRTPPKSLSGMVSVLVPVCLAVYTAGLPAVLEVADRADTSIPVAQRAIQAAEDTNANRALVIKEAVDKAKVLKEASSADSFAAATATGIEFTQVGGITSAAVSKVMPGVTVQFTVSGTDGYYNSGTQQSDASGRVSFDIPSAARGVRDTISVTAVLSGITARTIFIW